MSLIIISDTSLDHIMKMGTAVFLNCKVSISPFSYFETKTYIYPLILASVIPVFQKVVFYF